MSKEFKLDILKKLNSIKCVKIRDTIYLRRTYLNEKKMTRDTARAAIETL